MAGQLIVVKAVRDDETHAWYVESSDLPGLNAEADTLEALIEKLPNIVGDLIEESGIDDDTGGDGQSGDRDIPIELIAHASARIRIRVAV